jgi:hypothetical protein
MAKKLQGEGSLEFFLGSLGSGKTSFAFERALQKLLLGGTVVTNIEAYPDVIAEWMARERGLVFDPSRLIIIQDGDDVWSKAVRGVEGMAAMLLVDEAHVEHNARDFQKTKQQQLMFNTMVRKLKIECVYITQDLNNVDKQFRRMAQKIVYCRNLAHHKFLGLFGMPFNLFVRVPYVCGPGVRPMKQSPEVTTRPISWGMFNSHSLVGKAHETFGGLAVANAAPLKRIPKPRASTNWPAYAATAVGSALAFL